MKKLHPSRGAHLSVDAGPIAGQRIAVSPLPFSIGRSPERELVVPDPTVSRDHACIESTPEGYVVRDRGSTQGTLVNGEPITQRLLQTGDILQLGCSRMVFGLDVDAASPQARRLPLPQPRTRVERPTVSPQPPEGGGPSPRCLSGLNAAEYEHDFDRRALGVVQRVPGLDALIRKVHEYGVERALRIQLTGNCLRVSNGNFGDLQDGLALACRALDVAEPPRLYVELGPEANAYTAGTEHPVIVLTSGCVDVLAAPELLYVLGHELGHIKSQHVLYHQTAWLLPQLTRLAGSAAFGLAGLVGSGLELTLAHWQRMSEFTADRAGLLACQDQTAAVTALMKLAGAPSRYFGSLLIDDFVAQAREFESLDYDSLDKATKLLMGARMSHPWTVMRAAELLRWIESGSYGRVLERSAKSTSEKCLKD